MASVVIAHCGEFVAERALYLMLAPSRGREANGQQDLLMRRTDICLIELHRVFEFTYPVSRHRAYALGCLHVPN
jgi:hypothetical protein